MDIDKSTIKQIVQRIFSITQPDKIILFGSAAADRMSPDSDVDLLIVEPDISDQRDQYFKIQKALWYFHYPFDILFITTQWFEESNPTEFTVGSS